MAVAFATSATTNTFPGSTSYVANLPSGLAAGDLLVFWANSSTNGQTITTPAGYTVPTGAPVNINTTELYCFWRILVAGDAEIGGSTKTLTISSATGSMVVQAQRFTGAGIPEAFGSNTAGGGGLTSIAVAATPLGAQRMIATAVAAVDGSSTTISSTVAGDNSITFTEDQDQLASGNLRQLSCAHGSLAASTATETVTYTISRTVTEICAGSLVIPPADSGAQAQPWTLVPPGLFGSPAGEPAFFFPPADSTYVPPLVAGPDLDANQAQPWNLVPPGLFGAPASGPPLQFPPADSTAAVVAAVATPDANQAQPWNLIPPGLFGAPASGPPLQFPPPDSTYVPVVVTPTPEAIQAQPWTLTPPGLFINPHGEPGWLFPPPDSTYTPPVIPPAGPAVTSGPGGVFPITVPAPVHQTNASRTPTCRCDVYLNGAKQATLQVLSGSVSEDENRDTRRQCTVTLIDPTGTLVPAGMTSLLAPKGTELWIYVDDIQVGVFRITKPAIAADAKGGVTIKLGGDDRSRLIARHRWEAPYQPVVGTSFDVAIAALIDNRAPGIVKLFTPSNFFIQDGTGFGAASSNDPWKDAVGLATTAGLSLFFDAQGVLCLRPAVVDYNNPKSSLVSGSGLLISATRDLAEDQTFNGMIVTGESPGVPAVRVAVWDTDPTSRTYYDPAFPLLSTYGPVPDFYSSPLITTADQATAVGLEMLRLKLGLIEIVKAQILPDPTLHCGDVVRIGHPQAHIDGYYVISALTLPLGRGLMSITCRSRRIL